MKLKSLGLPLVGERDREDRFHGTNKNLETASFDVFPQHIHNKNKNAYLNPFQ